MKVSVSIANIYSTILEETKKELVIEKEGKLFIGALFFEQIDEEIKDYIEKINVEGSVLDIILTAYNLKKKYNMIAKDNCTLTTMLHWQYCNGFSNELFTESYECKDDTEFLKLIESNK